jgi:hypothetical protein
MNEAGQASATMTTAMDMATVSGPADHAVAAELLATLDAEHPMLAGWPARERVMAATWLAGYRSAPHPPRLRRRPGRLVGLAGRPTDRRPIRPTHPCRPVDPRSARCRRRLLERRAAAVGGVELDRHLGEHRLFLKGRLGRVRPCVAGPSGGFQPPSPLAVPVSQHHQYDDQR